VGGEFKEVPNSLADADFKGTLGEGKG